MTLITDGDGTRWVDVPVRKRRISPRALRFADLNVGDQLMQTRHLDGFITIDRKGHRQVWYWLVTDLWFDPVAGQEDETAGRMVAIRMIDARTGEPYHRKQPHTLRGLASQGFHYADIDFIAHVKARNEGMAEGAVVGIGRGHVIRRRPRLPGAKF